MANCSRGIRNTWHSYHALVVVVKVVCGGFGIVTHALTERCKPERET
nr:DUF3265 domain-containing protein [Vibrio lentus]